MMTEYDIIIIGAGPAGLSAARTGAQAGAKILLIDEQLQPGGQIYRSVQSASKERLTILGSDYGEGFSLVGSLDHENITVKTSATVWRVDEDAVVTYSVNKVAARASGRHLIIATGALERPMPVPGWTLPGVMTAGAAQILLKGSGVVPMNTVLIGAGPLLYLTATQLINAGVPPKALIETQSLKSILAALRFLPKALRATSVLLKGFSMLRQIRRAGVPRFTGAREIVINGEEAVSDIEFSKGGRRHKIACDTVLQHCGVIPNTQISRSLRLDHDWDGLQQCFRPRCDSWGISSNPTISIAGDGSGIGGAGAAAISGAISALGALNTLKIGAATTILREKSKLREKLFKTLAVRPFLDAAYRPANKILRPDDDVMICRCEEVTAGDIRNYAKLGCTGPNQSKAFGRSGMGPCQGRYCGLTVTELLAEATGIGHDDIGYYRLRSPLKPVSLGEMASLAEETNNKD